MTPALCSGGCTVAAAVVEPLSSVCESCQSPSPLLVALTPAAVITTPRAGLPSTPFTIWPGSAIVGCTEQGDTPLHGSHDVSTSSATGTRSEEHTSELQSRQY